MNNKLVFCVLAFCSAFAVGHRQTYAQFTWDIGYENVFLTPYFERDIAFKDIGSGTVEHSFDWEMSYSPRVWLGQTTVTGGGWRITYLYFDDDSQIVATESAGQDFRVNFDRGTGTSSINVGGAANPPAGTLTVQSSMKLHVIDFEVFQNVVAGPLGLKVSGGVRYVHLDRDFMAAESPGGEFINAGHTFDGAGPTVKIEANTVLIGQILFFMNTRASVMFGQEGQVVQGEAGGADLDLKQSSNSLLPILESQVGLELPWEMSGRVVTFRAAIEGQVWIGGGGWDFGNSGGGSDFPGDAGSFGLFGFVLSGEVPF